MRSFEVWRSFSKCSNSKIKALQHYTYAPASGQLWSNFGSPHPWPLSQRIWPHDQMSCAVSTINEIEGLTWGQDRVSPKNSLLQAYYHRGQSVFSTKRAGWPWLLYQVDPNRKDQQHLFRCIKISPEYFTPIDFKGRSQEESVCQQSPKGLTRKLHFLWIYLL